MFTIEIDLGLTQQCFPCFFNIPNDHKLEFMVRNKISFLYQGTIDLIVDTITARYWIFNLLFNVLLMSE